MSVDIPEMAWYRRYTVIPGFWRTDFLILFKIRDWYLSWWLGGHQADAVFWPVVVAMIIIRIVPDCQYGTYNRVSAVISDGYWSHLVVEIIWFQTWYVVGEVEIRKTFYQGCSLEMVIVEDSKIAKIWIGMILKSCSSCQNRLLSTVEIHDIVVKPIIPVMIDVWYLSMVADHDAKI